MNSLKSIRFVYRQHLLPPLVLPFNRTNSFLKTLEGGGVDNEKKMKQKLSQINDTIIQQVFKYKQHFVHPLKACPFYYDMFDKVVQRKLSKHKLKGKYQQSIKQILTDQRMRLYRQFERQYSQFQSKLQQQNLDLLKKVKFVPIFIYDSRQDYYLQRSKKKEEELSKIDKEKIYEKYQKKLLKYWGQLEEVAIQSKMTVDELFSLQKKQLDPELPQGLKALLFN